MKHHSQAIDYHKLFKKNLIYGIIIIILILVVLLFYYLIKENFTSDIEKVLAQESKNDTDFHQCLDQADEISYLSNGQYDRCSNALRQLSTSNIDLNNDIGFGKINEVCPIDSLILGSSKCLQNRLNSQNTSILNESQLFNKSPRNLEINKMVNKFDLEKYKKNLNKLMADQKITDTIKYIKDNKLKTSNDPYEPVINNILNPVTQTPSPSEIPITEESIATAKLQLGS
jgi:hypothetical protein